MKGSIILNKQSRHPYWRLYWYEAGKRYAFDRYPGEKQLMYQVHPHKDRDIGYQKAIKLRSMIQSDFERAQRGEGTFNIRRYKDQTTDAIPYLEQWLSIIQQTVMPGTIKSYKTAVNVHLIPFFERHPVQLHEIGKDTILLLMREMENISPKHKLNVVMVLHACLKLYAESNRNYTIPAFPKKKDFKLIKKPPQWITRERQENILNAISEEHQPIFRWMQFHWRREGEAVALLKDDYNERFDAFLIHRGVSSCIIVERTKTGEIHLMPCHPEFKKYIRKADIISPYFFTYHGSRSEGKRYTENTLRKIWNQACEKVNEKIDIHRGLRTSSASSAINEENWSLEEVQKYGQWSSRAAVEMYADYEMDRIRELQRRATVISLEARKKRDCTESSQTCLESKQ